MDERTKRLRLARKRHRHEMTKKRQRKHKMREFYAKKPDAMTPATTNMALLALAALSRKRR